MIEKFSRHIDKESFEISVFNMIPQYDHVIFDMFVSNVCNLKCRHCYFLDYKPKESSLSLQNWYDIIDDCVSLGIKHFHFSGKEPFCDPRIPLLLEKLNDIAKKHDLEYGVVTNGTMLNAEYLTKLINSHLTYLEFSLEGDSTFNQKIRGVNSFDSVLNLISRVSDKSKLNITSTYFGNNLLDLQNMIKMYANIGVSKFNIAPFLKYERNTLLPVEELDYRLMVDLICGLREFLESIKKKSLDVRICVTRRQAFDMFRHENALTEDIGNYIYNGNPLLYKINGNILEVNFPLLFIPFLSQLVVTTDGLVIPCADDIHYVNLRELALADMKYDNIATVIKKRHDFISTYINQKLNKDEKN